MTEKDRAIDAAVNLILSITQHGDSPIEHLEKAVTELCPITVCGRPSAAGEQLRI